MVTEVGETMLETADMSSQRHGIDQLIAWRPESWKSRGCSDRAQDLMRGVRNGQFPVWSIEFVLRLWKRLGTRTRYEEREGVDWLILMEIISQQKQSPIRKQSSSEVETKQDSFNFLISK